MTAWRVLVRWILAAEVPKRKVFASIAAATASQMASNALSVGAPLLLCFSWTQQHWPNPLQRIAIPLVIIELLAFFRSPLRYLDRMNSHRLGFAAVTRWRVWLTRRVAMWSFRATANTSRAELLQQSISDIDHLQDLWLRVTVPMISSITSFAITVGLIALFLTEQPAQVRSEISFLLALFSVSAVVLAILASQLRRAVASITELRRAHQRGFEELLGRQQLVTELSLLGTAALDSYFNQPVEYQSWHRAQLQHANWWRRIDMALATLSAGFVVCASLVGCSLVVLKSPEVASATVVNLGLLGVLTASLTGELFATWRSGIEAAANVVATAEALEARGEISQREQGVEHWPENVTQFNVQDVFACTPGSRVAIVGPSGSGKSTWLRGIANLEHAGATMLANNTYLNTLSDTELRAHVAYVPTEPNFLGMTLADELTLGRPHVSPWEPVARSLLLSVDATIRPSECSRGERHRYAIARALIAKPDLILLDEPTAGLGEIEREALIKTLWETKATLIIATHDAALIAKCDVVIPVEAFRG